MILIDVAVCDPPCQNGGACVSPATCSCLPGYTGKQLGQEHSHACLYYNCAVLEFREIVIELIHVGRSRHSLVLILPVIHSRFKEAGGPMELHTLCITCYIELRLLGTHSIMNTLPYHLPSNMHTLHKGATCETDVDECASSSSNNCHGDRAECVNTMGGHFCRCRTGFTGNGTHCEGIEQNKL